MTAGTRCSGGAIREFLVLSTEPASCATHAQAFQADDPARFVRISLPGSASFSTTQTLCVDGACAPSELSVAFDGTSGSWQGTVGGVTRDQSFTATRCDFDAHLPPTAGDSPVGDLTIREIAIYQGVKIPLVQNGTQVGPSAPIVAGREALVRVFVEPGSGWDGRETVARLDLGTGEPIEASATIGGVSSEGDGSSTFNLFVPGDRITEDVSFAVGIYDLDPACSGGSGTGGARFPSSGTATLPARSMGGTFDVVIVPVAYDADGSGRMPDTSPATMEAWRDYMYSLFPVADLNLSVRSRPLRWGSTIGANGSGWSSLLNQCMAERNSDGVAADTYYYCIFAPADSFRNFCSRGCVSGLGPVPSARDSYSRASIGLGYPSSNGTFAHEVGHSLGRPHAPCGGASGAEAGYPYSGGGIGSWGYDVLSRELKDPSRHSDIMGYCDSQWISDYNYENIFERIATVKGAFAISAPPQPFATIVVEPDGTLVPGAVVEMPFAPDGDAVTGTWSSGVMSDGVFMPVDHIDGGILYLPLPEGSVTSVTVPGFGTVNY
ncbi:MAG: hypothetical protein JJ863_10790 [Deltaproteobacteria bacterium]|nr:hypothetical protein [Deltaproteobacteria bacterium]